MAEKLKIIPLGGLNEIGKNMTAYEYGGEIIVVDCGMAFPGDDMYGIDCVIPDVSYLIKNKSRIRGLFITHGHEDHIGAIPYVLKQINMPIYCTRFTAGLIKLKLEEHQLVKSTKLITVEAGKSVRAGKFTVEFIHVNHSIADSVAFAIHTKMGTIVHTGDFKIDSTPIDGEVIDLARLGELGKEGVLCLCADSTNVERPGFTPSEKVVGATFMRQFQNCDERIIVTTFASNVHRVQQVLDAAAQCGRKVAVTGRSMENMMKVSTELGYMKVPKNTLVDINKLKGLPKNKQVIVTTGSQGEEMSALYRMAFSTHKQVEIGAGDKVILSASAVPGNEVTVGRVINELFRKGATVIYDRADMLHVSGHACQEELKIIHALTKPRFFVPLHGEQRMLQIHCQLAQQMGMDRNHIAIADNGGVIEITGKSMKLSANSVPAGEVYVDGSGVGDVGAVVMRDRKRLAEDGMVVVVLSMSSHDHRLLCEPEIVTRGFVYVKESEGLMEELRKVAVKALEECRMDTMNDWASIKSEIKNAISGFLYKKTKRNPMILPGIMERDSSGRLTRYEKTGYLPPDFDRPMVKNPMLTLPNIDDTIAPDSLPMWRVQKEGYMSKRGIRVGMVSRPGGFEDSPEAEIISGGVSGKTWDAVAIGRHGNFLHWGFAASPDDMTEEARDVFANAVVYIAGFAGQTPVARKYNDRIITRHDITLRAFSATRRAYALNVETMKNHAARMEDLKHMICMTPTEKKIVLK